MRFAPADSLRDNPAQTVVTPKDDRFFIHQDEVHIWHTELLNPDEAHQMRSLLSSDELQRADRFKFPEHRRRFVIARGCLRQLTAAYLNVAAKAVRFAYSAEGKPQLAPEFPQELSFNVSHSEDLAVFSFATNRKIGVDVEVFRYDVDTEGIPRRFFSDVEQRALAGLHGQEKIQGFFNCWTRKEAYVKAVGQGLSLPLRDFDVSLLPGEAARILATRPDPQIASHWSIEPFYLNEQCAAAVVVEGRIAALQVRQFVPLPVAATEHK